jgi:hypothetical protein
MSTRDIVLAHPWQGHAVGETVTLDEDRARQLVQAAAGRYADEEPVYPSEATFPTPEPPVAPVAAPKAVQGDTSRTPDAGTVTKS